jgi:small-conductance mechanosensitive channel
MMQEEAVDKVKEVIEEDVWGTIVQFFKTDLVPIGEGENAIHITVGLLLLVVISLITTNFILNWIRRLLTRKMTQEDRLKFISVFKFARYFAYLIVVLIALASAGVNVNVILTASAALLVGIGFALQELFLDIIGGIFIMIDKSLNVGDIIESENRVGRVLEIRLRTTRALTRDDKVIIIPNHKFIKETIYNYTQNHKTTRESIKVGVAYGTDTALTEKLLLECVKEHEGILKVPKPFVLFEDFGDSALVFGLYFFVKDSFVDPRIKSDLRFTIDKKFRENNITIPFPQRDIYIHQKKE